MAPGDKGPRVIFIGNIPYGLTEEQIIHTFSNVGQVLNFRLVYDKETGRPKGFGFMEFSDADAAASAVRNLHEHEVMGRKLRVDYTNEGGSGDGNSGGNTGNQHQQQQQSQQHQQQPQQQPQQMPTLHIPPGPSDAYAAPPQPTATNLNLPQGAELPPNLSCPDAISRTLSTLPAPQLLDILSQMKGLVMSDPTRATELLRQAPQLSYAIFQSLLLLGLVDTTILASVVEQSAPPQQQQQQTPIPPQQQQQQQQPQQMAIPPPPPPIQQQQKGYPQYPPPPPQFAQMNAPTPPAQGLPYHMPQHQPPQPPPQQPPPPQQQQQHQQQMPDHAALVTQIMSMTQQQIDALPPAERAQVMQARQAILSGHGF